MSGEPPSPQDTGPDAEPETGSAPAPLPAPDDIRFTPGSTDPPSQATVVEEIPAPVGQAPFLTRAGVQLAFTVLAIMAFVVLLQVAVLTKSEFSDPPPGIALIDRLAEQAGRQALAASSAENTRLASDLLRQSAEARKEVRAHWQTVFQMLLLNIFLPVLTSILGYVFGTSKAQG